MLYASNASVWVLCLHQHTLQHEWVLILNLFVIPLKVVQTQRDFSHVGRNGSIFVNFIINEPSCMCFLLVYFLYYDEWKIVPNDVTYAETLSLLILFATSICKEQERLCCLYETWIIIIPIARLFTWLAKSWRCNCGAPASEEEGRGAWWWPPPRPPRNEKRPPRPADKIHNRFKEEYARHTTKITEALKIS